MHCVGVIDRNEFNVRGSYEAPLGHDWGWRIMLAIDSDDSISLVIHNISRETPNAKHYTRSTSASQSAAWWYICFNHIEWRELSVRK